MGYVWIHIRVEPILIWRLITPGGGRFLGYQRYLHHRLNALEPIFPRHHQSNGSTILWWECLTVKTGRQNCQRMHGFIETKSFHVWPSEATTKWVRHTFAIVQGLEGYILCLRSRFHPVEELLERKPYPGNDH